jgi:hypothetical protein
LYAGKSPIAVLNSIWSDVGSPSGREARFEADASNAIKWSHAANAYTGVEDTPVLRKAGVSTHENSFQAEQAHVTANGCSAAAAAAAAAAATAAT